MKRIVSGILLVGIVFGGSACGGQTEEVSSENIQAETQLSEEAPMIFWNDEKGQEPEAFLKALAEDVSLALLDSKYPDPLRFTEAELTPIACWQEEEETGFAFDLLASYENSEAEQADGKLQTVAVPLRFSIEREDGQFALDSLVLTARQKQESRPGMSVCPLGEYLSDFGTMPKGKTVGEIEMEPLSDGRMELEIEEMLWVEETHGYSDNGYFLTELNRDISMQIEADCPISYFIAPSAMETTTVREYQKTFDTEDRLYEIIMEDGEVVSITERYRP